MKILNDKNTMLCPIKNNGNTIELTVHTSCYWDLRLSVHTSCYWDLRLSLCYSD